MRASSWLLVLFAGLVACPSFALDSRHSSDWRRRQLEEARAEAEQRRRVEEQIRRIEEQRKKIKEAEQKKARTESLEAIKQAFEKGKTAYEEQLYSVAYLHLSAVASCGLKDAAKMAAEARTKVVEIEGMARAKLDQAELLLLRGDAAGAAKAFLEIAQDFPHGEAAERAGVRLRALKTTPAVAASLRYSQGKANEDAENYGKALEIYDEVVLRWPDEIAALRAKVAARRIREDPEKSRMATEARELQAERQCPTILNLAKNYLINNDSAGATARLKQVVEDFPGTTYAEQAAAVIDALAEHQPKMAMRLLTLGSEEEPKPEAPPAE